VKEALTLKAESYMSVTAVCLKRLKAELH
jgi:hypothetical protein